MSDKIAIEIVFSNKLDETIAQSVKAGEIKDKYELLRRLASVYQQEIKQNHDFMKPLKALDKNVTVRVVISED